MNWLKQKLMDWRIKILLSVFSEKNNRDEFIKEMRKNVSIPNFDREEEQMIFKATYDILFKLVVRYVSGR